MRTVAGTDSDIPKSQYAAEGRRSVLSILLKDGGQYNKLRQKRRRKFMLCLRAARTLNHRLQLLVQIRVQEIYMFHKFLTASIPVEISAGFVLVK
jgi:hypothetical protein